MRFFPPLLSQERGLGVRCATSVKTSAMQSLGLMIQEETSLSNKKCACNHFAWGRAYANGNTNSMTTPGCSGRLYALHAPPTSQTSEATMDNPRPMPLTSPVEYFSP